MRRTDEHRGDWKEWRRFRAWELAQQGWSQNEIAEALGVTEGAVSQWIKVRRERGEAGLRGKIAQGPASRLSKEQLGQLPGLLEDASRGSWRAAGEVWTHRSRGSADRAAVEKKVSPSAYESSARVGSSTACNNR